MSEQFGKRPTLVLFLRVLILVGAFSLLYKSLMQATHLRAGDYADSVLVLELFQRLGLWPIAALIVVAFLLVKYGALGVSWSQIELGQPIRILIVTLAALVAWPFVAYGYNYFFDQWHLFDRLLLVLLVPLIYVRPLFVFPYLVVIFTIGWQFDQPLGGLLWAHKLQVIHVITLFGTFLLISALTGQRRTQDFLFVALCIVAAAYWQPGLAKLRIEWLGFGHHYQMPLAAYLHGWLAFADVTSVFTYSLFLKKIDVFLHLFVIALEIGCLFFLIHRRATTVFLFLFVIFHLGVFALYGYLFWTWIALDIALLILVLRFGNRLEFFSRPYIALSVLLIGFAEVWCAPASLAWFDTRLSYTFRYEVTGAGGRAYDLPPRFFAPYGDIFTMGNFGYLVPDHARLTGPYAIVEDRKLAQAIQQAKHRSEIFSFEDALGRDRYDSRRSQIFYTFVSKYIENWNKHLGGTAIPRFVRAPPQFWSFGRGNVFDGSEPIRQIRIVEVTTLIHNDHYEEIRSIDLKTLDIPVPDSPKFEQGPTT